MCVYINWQFPHLEKLMYILMPSRRVLHVCSFISVRGASHGNSVPRTLAYKQNSLFIQVFFVYLRTWVFSWILFSNWYNFLTLHNLCLKIKWIAVQEGLHLLPCQCMVWTSCLRMYLVRWNFNVVWCCLQDDKNMYVYFVAKFGQEQLS